MSSKTARLTRARLVGTLRVGEEIDEMKSSGRVDGLTSDFPLHLRNARTRRRASCCRTRGGALMLRRILSGSIATPDTAAVGARLIADRLGGDLDLTHAQGLAAG